MLHNFKALVINVQNVQNTLPGFITDVYLLFPAPPFLIFMGLPVVMQKFNIPLSLVGLTAVLRVQGSYEYWSSQAAFMWVTGIDGHRSERQGQGLDPLARVRGTF